MSTLDILLNLFPNMKRSDVHSKEAQSLYELWSNPTCQVSGTTFTRPLNVSMENVMGMQKIGLVNYDGNNISITKSGIDLLRKMILDDDDFAITYKREN